MNENPLAVREQNEEPGLVLEPAFISGAPDLYQHLRDGIVWDERMKARRTASFGRAYNYSGITYPEVLMHPELAPIVDLLESRLGFRPNNCLVNYYADGNSTMGFHSDLTRELAPGTGVAIVSTGSERSITFRSKQNERVSCSYRLPAGSLLYMPAEVQAHWKHAILAERGAGGRISLTFRQIL